MSDPVVDVILEKVKLALRYVDDALNTEISDVIAAAKLEIEIGRASCRERV